MRKTNTGLLILLLLICLGEAKIIVSIPELENLAERISGEEVESILPSAVDPHFFSLSYQDLRKVQNAKLVLLANSELIEFEAEIKKICGNKCLDFADYNATIFEFPGIGYNKHAYWLLPENILKIALAIKNKLVEIDPEKMEYYSANYREFERSLMNAKKDAEKLVKELKDFDLIAIDPHSAYAISALGLNVSIAFPEEISLSAMEIQNLKRFEKCIIVIPDYQEKTKVGEIAKQIAREVGCGIAKVKVVSELSFESQLISNAFSLSNPIYLTSEYDYWKQILSLIVVLETIALVVLWRSRRKT
ncbi:MAG: zinc ABC transporter substrate-binding protein [Archaeoglobaceae archaeon]|nr:zinc ABC transporter substrate-binding protein [Archaeoglobaceae archaeon]MDW8127683.1 zinc ABC transporter substrate-binding protein [Archaeoglobaceae archaeon]